jgi:anti-anti-sigma factor
MEGVMDLKTERVGSAVILHLEGRLTVEADTERLQDMVNSVARLHARDVLLDMREIRQLDCSGIGQILNLRNQFHNIRMTFALMDIERHQKRMLKISGLLRVFRVFGSREEALAAVGAGPVRARSLEPAAPLRALVGMQPAACWASPASWAETGGLR